jgi:hypothetical protein
MEAKTSAGRHGMNMYCTHIPPFILPNASVTTSMLNPHNSGASEDEEDEDEGQHPRKRQHADSTSDSDKLEADKEQEAGALEGGRTAGEGDQDAHNGQGYSGG